MVRHHPFQNVCFNVPAGSNMDEVRRRFDVDQRGLSYRELLEQVLKNDTAAEVRVRVSQEHGVDNVWLLPPDQRERLKYPETSGQDHYFLSEYRWHPGDYGFPDECCAVRVCGGKVAAAYHVRTDELDTMPGYPPPIADSTASRPDGDH